MRSQSEKLTTLNVTFSLRGLLSVKEKIKRGEKKKTTFRQKMKIPFRIFLSQKGI